MFAVLAGTFGLPSAFASPRLRALLESSASQYFLQETTRGSELIQTLMGRRLASGELERLMIRLGEAELQPVSQQLEQRLAKVTQEFEEAFPHRDPRLPLTLEQRSLLQTLSQRALGPVEQEVGRALRLGAPQSTFFTRLVSGSRLRGAELRLPRGATPEVDSAARLQYGFESEYTLQEIDRLTAVYGPTAEFGISPERWLQMPQQERGRWVREHLRELFPNQRERGKLVRLSTDPRHQFLPEHLIQDSTGNLEIVCAPVESLEQWQLNINHLNELFGAGSMQGTVSLPTEFFHGNTPSLSRIQSVVENTGYFNFMADLDTLQKMEVGAARYLENPNRPVANSFKHSFLGPMTRLKQVKLMRMLEANSRGSLLDAETLRAVSGSDDSFKYVGGTAYRPDIVRGRVIFEVRDAHNNMDALLERVSRATYFLQNGRAGFAPAVRLRAFDSRADFERLPDSVQQMLRRLFPAKLAANTDYSETERLALEVFRNWAFPLRDWNPQVTLLGGSVTLERVRAAQSSYLSELEKIAHDLTAGTLTPEQASFRAQGALVRFSPESGLFNAYQEWLTQLVDRIESAPRQLNLGSPIGQVRSQNPSPHLGGTVNPGGGVDASLRNLTAAEASSGLGLAAVARLEAQVVNLRAQLRGGAGGVTPSGLIGASVGSLNQLQVTAVQYAIEGNQGVPAFLLKLERAVLEAKASGAQLVVFPELTVLDLLSSSSALSEAEQLTRIAQEVTPTYFEQAAQLSREWDIAILAGSSPRRTERGIVNSAQISLPDGRRVIQDKLFLTPDEVQWNFVPGESLRVFDTPWGRTSVLICYDSQFPGLSERLSALNPELILVPSMTGRDGFSRVRWAAQARAVEQHAYVVVTGTVDAAGTRSRQFLAQAAILTPRDQGFRGVLAQGRRNQEALVSTTLDLRKLRESRARAGIYPARDSQQRTTPIRVRHQKPAA